MSWSASRRSRLTCSSLPNSPGARSRATPTNTRACCARADFELVGELELAQREGADGLDEPQARRVLQRRRRRDHRALDEAAERAGHRDGVAPVADEQLLRLGDPERPAEHRQMTQIAPLDRAEALVAPVDRRLDRALTRGPVGVERHEMIQAALALHHRLDLDRDTGEPARGGLTCGKFDRQWQPVQRTADAQRVLQRVRIRARTGVERPRALEQELDRIGQRPHHRTSLGAQRRYLDGTLAVEAQRSPARGDDEQVRTAAAQLRDELPAGLVDVLAIVEHEQQSALRQVPHKRGGHRLVGEHAHAELTGDHGGDVLRLRVAGESGEPDEPCAVGEPRDAPRRELQRQPRLAAASGADQGDDAPRPDALREARELGVAADEERRLHGQVVSHLAQRVRRHGGSAALGDLEHRLARCEVLKPLDAQVAQVRRRPEPPARVGRDEHLSALRGACELPAARGARTGEARADRHDIAGVNPDRRSQAHVRSDRAGRPQDVSGVAERRDEAVLADRIRRPAVAVCQQGQRADPAFVAAARVRLDQRAQQQAAGTGAERQRGRPRLRIGGHASPDAVAERAHGRADGAERADRLPVRKRGLGRPSGTVEGADELRPAPFVVRVLEDLPAQGPVEPRVLPEDEAYLVELELDLVAEAVELAGMAGNPRFCGVLDEQWPGPRMERFGEDRAGGMRERDERRAAPREQLEALGVDEQRVVHDDPVAVADVDEDPPRRRVIVEGLTQRLDRDLNAVAPVGTHLVSPERIGQRVDRHRGTRLDKQAAEQPPALLAERDRGSVRRKAHGHRTQDGVLDLGHRSYRAPALPRAE